LVGVEVAEGGGLVEVADGVGVDVHQGAAGGVGGEGVVGEDDTAEVAGGAVEGAVAFHGFDAVGDDVMDGDGGGEFDDGVVDALPVQGVLRPAVDRAGECAEEVLQAEGDAGPVVGFDLGHRDDDVGGEERFGEPEFVEGGEGGLGGDGVDAIVVKVDEAGAAEGMEGIAEAAFFEQQRGVADVAGSVADEDGLGAEAIEGFGGGGDECGPQTLDTIAK